MTELEQLKKELQEKINQLNACLENQQFLSARLKNTTAALEDIKCQLKGVEAFVAYSNEHIYQLKLENQKLKLSSDAWMRRAINLELKILSVRNTEN